MAELAIARIDFRLIHGQVITKWRKVFSVTKVIIIDDKLAKDEFMAKVYLASAPTDLTVKIYDEEKAVRLWEKNEYREGTVMLLFRDLQTCCRIIKKGVPAKAVQIGGLPKGEGRKSINTSVYMSEEDAKVCKELNSIGVNCYIHTTPDLAKVDYDTIMKKFNV